MRDKVLPHFCPALRQRILHLLSYPGILQRLCRSNHDQALSSQSAQDQFESLLTHPLGSRYSDVESTPIGQKADIASIIAPHRAEQDDLLFPPFKPIHRLDLNIRQLPRSVRPQHVDDGARADGVVVQVRVQYPYLSAIWRNDSNIRSAQILKSSQPRPFATERPAHWIAV